MFGTWFGPMAGQLLQSLCPLTAGHVDISLIFALATQPQIGLHQDVAPLMHEALQGLLEHVECPNGFDAGKLAKADLQLDLRDDAPDAELQDLAEAYPEDAWWHGESRGRLKWASEQLYDSNSAHSHMMSYDASICHVWTSLGSWFCFHELHIIAGSRSHVFTAWCWPHYRFIFTSFHEIKGIASHVDSHRYV